MARDAMRPPARRTEVAEYPCPTTGVSSDRCSRLRKPAASVVGAAHSRSQHGRGIPVGSNRSDYGASACNALFAPKRTPKLIVDQLSAALDEALDDEPTRKRLFDLGGDILGKDQRANGRCSNLVKSEIAKWTPVIKAAGPLK